MNKYGGEPPSMPAYMSVFVSVNVYKVMFTHKISVAYLRTLLYNFVSQDYLMGWPGYMKSSFPKDVERH